MMNLVKAEFKKLFKSKVNIILLILLFMLSGYNCYKNYTTVHLYDEKTETIPSIFTLHDVEGNTIKEVDYWRLADNTNHSYAGELNEDLLTKMQNDYDQIYHPDDAVDTAFMKKLYGDNYKSKIAYAEEGKYTHEEFRVDFADYIHYVGGYSIEEIPDSDRIIVHPKIYTKADHQNLLYLNIYDFFSYQTEESTYQDLKFDNLKTWMNASNLTDEEIQEEIIYASPEDSNTSITAFDTTSAVFTQRYKNSEKKMESRIGNNLFVYSISNLGFLSLVVLTIILSNIFAMEKQYKTDQIMVPTAKGNHRITFSKLLCGYFTAFGTMAIIFLITLIFSFLFVPMRSLNLVYFAQSGTSIEAKEFLFTYGELIGNGILLISIAALVIALLTMAFSYIIKNRIGTVIPILLFIFLGSGTFLSNIITGLPLDNFIPTQMMNFLSFFNEHGGTGTFFPYTTISGSVIAWKDIIILFWLIIIVVVSFLLIHHSRKHIVKNC